MKPNHQQFNLFSKRSFFIFVFSIFVSMSHAQSFSETQLQFERVKEANIQKYEYLKTLFRTKGISFPCNQIYIRAFKWNKTFELWAFSPDSNRYVLINTYSICAHSGDLGPKRQEGDYQTPEGFYHINVFNPISNYHLSLGINYPNKSDSILGVQGRLGGDIYIHGKCETIGCLPMTDAMIKEIYLIAMYAKDAGQENIPVHIFPVRLTPNNLTKIKSYFPTKPALHKFWANMKIAYDYFDKYKKVPDVSIDDLGNYVIGK